MCSLRATQLVHLVLQPLVYVAPELGSLLTHLTRSPIICGAKMVVYHFRIIVRVLVILVRLWLSTIIGISSSVEILSSARIEL